MNPFVVSFLVNAFGCFAAAAGVYLLALFNIRKEQCGGVENWEAEYRKIYAVHECNCVEAANSDLGALVRVPAFGSDHHKKNMDEFDKARDEWKKGIERASRLTDRASMTVSALVGSLVVGLLAALYQTNKKPIAKMAEINSPGETQLASNSLTLLNLAVDSFSGTVMTLIGGLVVVALYGYFIVPAQQSWIIVRNYINVRNTAFSNFPFKANFKIDHFER
jgi:hypothetical protein